MEKGKNVLVLCGRTASGKTTLAKELEKLGRRRIITYTTRKPRPGEICDVSYHFISEEDFMERKNRGFFAEWRSYVSSSGRVFYGSAKEDYEYDRVFAVLDPQGATAVKKLFGEAAVIVYLNASEELILERLKKRGDDIAEIRSRLKSDRDLFGEFALSADINMQIEKDYEPELLAELIDGLVKEEEE